jgi:hypothetical protein
VNFTPDDSGTVTATRFRVSAAPISYFTPAPLLYCVGNVQNGYGMALASNAAALDTGLYQATTTGPASTFWPTGSAYCPLTAGTPLCKGYAATVTTAGRLTSLASFPGHLLNVSAFAAQAGGFNGTQNVNNGVPVLEVRATLPTTFSTRTLAEITDFSSAGWPTSTGPLYGYSGMLVYDYDAFGRVRPFMKAVMYPICASARAGGGRQEGAARGRARRAPQRSSAPRSSPPEPRPDRPPAPAPPAARQITTTTARTAVSGAAPRRAAPRAPARPHGPPPRTRRPRR